MIRNTISFMRENLQALGIMVTGGFHTRELTKKMQQQDVSYIVITPKITRNVAGPYFDRLTGKKSDFDILMENYNQVVR